MDEEVKELGGFVLQNGPVPPLEGSSGTVHEELHIISLEIAALDNELKHCAATVAELLTTLIAQAKTVTSQGVALTANTVSSTPSTAPALDNDVLSPSAGTNDAGSTVNTQQAANLSSSSGEQVELQLFPTQCQRRLYLQALQWNDRIILAGQMLLALRNQVHSVSTVGPTPTASGEFATPLLMSG